MAFSMGYETDVGHDVCDVLYMGFGIQCDIREMGVMGIAPKHSSRPKLHTTHMVEAGSGVHVGYALSLEYVLGVCLQLGNLV